MPINAHPEYMNAEKRYQEASTADERLRALEEMLKYVPKHKGAETLRKNLRTRYKKLKQEQQQKAKKKASKKGIRKEDLQIVLVGETNTGKSSILKTLTNADPRIASYGFTTKEPEQGIFTHQGITIQVIDLPPLGSDEFDHGIVNNTDMIVIVVERVDEIKPIMDILKNKGAKRIIVFNKIDQYTPETKRKITETLRSKRYPFVLTSTYTGEGIDTLQERLIKSFDIIRVYTRQPGKTHDENPILLKPGATIEHAADKILHGYAKKVKYAKVSGPSGKFIGQRVGLKHVLKDKDIIELYTE